MHRICRLSFALALCLPTLALAAPSNTGMPADLLPETLAAAIRAHDSNGIREQLRAGADPNTVLSPHPYCCADGSTPFMIAAAQADTEAMRLLDEAGADIGFTYGFYGSALHAAARNGHVEAMRWLIDAGADPNTATGTEYGGIMPLHAATASGHAPAVALLLRSGACIDCTYVAENGGTYSPLVDAAAAGHTAIVEDLLTMGAEMNKRGGDGHFFGTPLAFAAYQGRADIVEILVASGADLNAGGDSPLHGGAVMGHLEIVKRLVSLGADLDARNLDNRTALTLARNYGHDAVAEYLQKAMAEQ